MTDDAEHIDPDKIADSLRRLVPEWRRSHAEWEAYVASLPTKDVTEFQKREKEEREKHWKDLDDRNVSEITYADGEYNTTAEVTADEAGIEIHGCTIPWSWVMRQFQQICSGQKVSETTL